MTQDAWTEECSAAQNRFHLSVLLVGIASDPDVLVRFMMGDRSMKENMSNPSGSFSSTHLDTLSLTSIA